MGQVLQGKSPCYFNVATQLSCYLDDQDVLLGILLGIIEYKISFICEQNF